MPHTDNPSVLFIITLLHPLLALISPKTNNVHHPKPYTTHTAKASTIVKQITNLQMHMPKCDPEENYSTISFLASSQLQVKLCIVWDVITIMGVVSWSVDVYCYDFRHEIENGHGSSPCEYSLRKMIRANTISLRGGRSNDSFRLELVD